MKCKNLTEIFYLSKITREVTLLNEWYKNTHWEVPFNIYYKNKALEMKGIFDSTLTYPIALACVAHCPGILPCSLRWD